MATTNNEKNIEEVAILLPTTSPEKEHNAKMGSPITSNRSDFSTSPEISKFSPSPKKPPRSPDLINSPLLMRHSTFKGKPKSRFGQPSVPIDTKTLQNLGSPRCDSFEFGRESPFSQRAVSFGHGTPREKEKEKRKKKAAPDEKEIYQRITAQLSAKKFKKMTVKVIIQLLLFLIILSGLISSLTVEKLKNKTFLSLEVWKGFVLLMVIFSGMLITHWFVHLVVFLIEWKYMLKKNVVYFTHALKHHVVVFIWLCVVLGTWMALFRPDIRRHSNTKRNILNLVTWTIVTALIGSFLWLIKTTLIKMLASSFQMNRFFDRIQEAVFHHYVLQALSGRPTVELSRKVCREDSESSQVSFTEYGNHGKEKKVVDWGKLHQMKRERVPSWTMQLLTDVMSNTGLSTVSGALGKDVVEGGVQLDDDVITSEEEAIATAVRVFENMVMYKDEQEYIDRSDLLRFMIVEEVNLIYPLLSKDEKGQISLKAFCEWVVKVYKDRQTLQHALNDNKTAINQLRKLLKGILIVVIFILWLLLTEIATTKMILFFSSQLVVAAFIFGNTCKQIFEAIIFVFVMHPFDVGDRCIIDGTLVLVEEMNILTTVFLKLNKEKVYYPNSVLATKPISNLYRSPDQADFIDFSISYTTSTSKIGQLQERVKQYLEQNPHRWHPEHTVFIREIENMNKIEMSLFYIHTINFQDILEKNRRRTEMALAMKDIFDDLEISYNLLPQKIHLRNLTDSQTNS